MAALALSRLAALAAKSPVCTDLVLLAAPQLAASLSGPFWADGSVIIRPVQGWKSLSNDPSWKDSLTMLHVFGPELIDYKRVVTFDHHAWIRKRPDELFAVKFTGALKVAAPRAYWLPVDDKSISSFIMVFEPNLKYWDEIQEAYSLHLHSDLNVDVDLLNRIWGGRFTLIDSIYASNTRDLERADAPFFNSTLHSSPMIHFFSPPLPQPWLASHQQVTEYIRDKPTTKLAKAFFEKIFKQVQSELVLLKAKVLC